MNKKIKVGDTVMYYPNEKESAKCNFQSAMPATVIDVFSDTNITLKYFCDGGKDMTKRNVSRKSNNGQTEVWDFKP